ncbi:hypothetical protein Gotri_026447 [Gossypium trilobum]|uniref:DUF4283 domain-containing protein n=1 Tax=Gossypium trilobum TaxID=34281 RepID=A0A7J9FPE5_9ROSI|nr:hypothetical protein [Gossypium trilobum]
MEDMGSEKEFFKDKFMDNVEGDVKVSTDGPYPKIFFSKHVHEILDKSMEQIVVVRFLGRTIGYKALINRIQSLWKPIWDFQMRLSGLPYKFYNKKLLRFIVGTLVKVVTMDYNTTTRKIEAEVVIPTANTFRPSPSTTENVTSR